MPAKISKLQHLGLAKEVTWGTAVAPTTYVPFDSVKAESALKTVKDDQLRNNINKMHNTYPTTRQATVDVETYLYPNEMGNILVALLGSDTVTGTGPYVHTMKPSVNQRSLTFNHFNGLEERQYAGMVVDEITIKGDAEGLVTVSFKAQGKFHVVVASTTPSIAAGIAAIAGLYSLLKIDTVTNANLFGFELSFKRANKLIFGANSTQDPTKVVQGQIEIGGKLTFDIVDNVESNMFDGQTYHAVDLTIGNAANNKAQVVMSRVFVDKATIDQGQENVRVDWEFTAHYNATDAGACAVTLTNTTAVAY